MDDRRRAYATLGLEPGATPDEVRHQFKALVRRWHPDRFLRDPQGQREAADRMRQINAAYDLLSERREDQTRASEPPPEPPGPSSEPRERVARPLSRDAIDGIVRSIGTKPGVEVLAEWLSWVWPLFVAYLIGPHRGQWLRDEIAGRPHPQPPIFVWQVLLVLLAIGLRTWIRRSRDEPGP